jgi:hypothetical protein
VLLKERYKKYRSDGRRERRRKQLLDDLEEKLRHWKFKEEALDPTVWRTRFTRGYGSVVKLTS